MNIAALLTAAGVPTDLHLQAIQSIEVARGRSRGLLLPKFFVRWFRAREIARLMRWQDERLIDLHPELAEWDIAPALNITGHGDNIPWIETPEGGRPMMGAWLNQDPESEEYKGAVAANYWCPGEHPRSQKSRAAWYRRNACEYSAWELGAPVDPSVKVQEWSVPGITVLRCGTVWQIDALRKCIGPIKLLTHIGFEVGNVFGVVNGRRVQCWFPLPGFALRACVTWAVYPIVSREPAV